MKGWIGLVGWLLAYGLPTQVVTHQLQVERRTRKVCRRKTGILPLCHATNDDMHVLVFWELGLKTPILVPKRHINGPKDVIWRICCQHLSTSATCASDEPTKKERQNETWYAFPNMDIRRERARRQIGWHSGDSSRVRIIKIDPPASELWEVESALFYFLANWLYKPWCLLHFQQTLLTVTINCCTVKTNLYQCMRERVITSLYNRFCLTPSITLVKVYTCTKGITAVTSSLAVVNVVFYSLLQSLPCCYARVIQQTCNSSTADINVLKTVLYNARLSNVIHSSCALGESHLFDNPAQHIIPL